MRFNPLVVLGGVALTVFACGSAAEDSGTTADAATQHDAGVARDAGDAATTEGGVEVTPPPLPVIPNQGGPVIAKPELVSITWAGASAKFVETPGVNLVFLYGQGKDYLTMRHLIVHAAH